MLADDPWETLPPGTNLPVLPSGCAGGLREMIEVPNTVDTFGAVARGPPAEPSESAQAAEAHEAAVMPQAILGRVVVIFGPWPYGRLFGRKLGRPQHRGNVQRAVLVGDVVLGLYRRCASRGAERRDWRVALAGRGVGSRDGRWLE